MPSRIGNNLIDQGNSVYRDPNKRITIQVTVSENNLPSGVNIEGNSVNFVTRKVVKFNINGITVYGREVPIFEGALKFKFAHANPDSVTEKICEENPITNGENDIALDRNDIKDTIGRIIDHLDEVGLLFP